MNFPYSQKELDYLSERDPLLGGVIPLERVMGIDLHLRHAQIMVRCRPAGTGNAHPRCIYICSIPFLYIKGAVKKVP